MSETVAGIPPPYRGPRPRPSITSLEIVGESLSMLRHSLPTRWDIWLVAAIFFTGTDIANIVFVTPGHPFQSPWTIASLIVRIASYVLVAVASLRAFTGQKSIWSVDLPLLRATAAFAALLLASIVILFAITRFVSRPLIAATIAEPHVARAASLIVVFLCLIGFAIATLRLSPWLVALAIGDQSIGLRSGWKGMRGATFAGIGALIWTAPVPILHLALTAEAQYLKGTPQLALTVIDSLISVLQVLLNMAIASVLYRFVSKNRSSAL